MYVYVYIYIYIVSKISPRPRAAQTCKALQTSLKSRIHGISLPFIPQGPGATLRTPIKPSVFFRNLTHFNFNNAPETTKKAHVPGPLILNPRNILSEAILDPPLSCLESPNHQPQNKPRPAKASNETPET